MQLKPEEISKIIRAQIKHYENAIEQSETGTVIMVGDGIARASGLEKCMAGELLQFDNGEYGMAQNLEENTVSIVLLGSDVGIKEGSTVKRTGKVVSVPVGEALIGRVVNALGQPIDGAGPIETTEYRAIESRAPGIIDRQPVKEPLQTGIEVENLPDNEHTQSLFRYFFKKWLVAMVVAWVTLKVVNQQKVNFIIVVMNLMTW